MGEINMNSTVTAAIAVLSYLCSVAFFCFGMLALANTGTHIGGLWAGLAVIAGFGGFAFGLIARS